MGKVKNFILGSLVTIPLGASIAYGAVAGVGLEKYKKENADLTATNITISTESENLNKQVQNLLTQKAELESNIEILQNALDLADKELADVEVELTTTKANLETVTLEKETLENTVNTLTSDIEVLRTQKNNLENELAASTEDKENLQSQLNSVNATLQTKENALSQAQSDLQIKESELDTLQVSYNSLLSEKENLENQITTLNATISEKENEISTLNSKLSKFDSRLTGISLSEVGTVYTFFGFEGLKGVKSNFFQNEDESNFVLNKIISNNYLNYSMWGFAIPVTGYKSNIGNLVQSVSLLKPSGLSLNFELATRYNVSFESGGDLSEFNSSDDINFQVGNYITGNKVLHKLTDSAIIYINGVETSISDYNSNYSNYKSYKFYLILDTVNMIPYVVAFDNTYTYVETSTVTLNCSASAITLPFTTKEVNNGETITITIENIPSDYVISNITANGEVLSVTTSGDSITFDLEVTENVEVNIEYNFVASGVL